MSVQKVSVKMGSRQFKIAVNTGNTKCSDLIANILDKSKIDRKLASTYSIYESVSGVERLMGNNENVLQAKTQMAVEFIIRKCVVINKKNVPRCEQQAKIKKYYEKINQKSQLKVSDVPLSAEKQNYMEIILKNEAELEKQSQKLKEFGSRSSLCNKHYDQLQSNMNGHKLADNINFLQFLYYKLKNQNDCDRLIDNNSCGNSSADEDSDDNSSCFSNSSNYRYESLV